MKTAIVILNWNGKKLLGEFLPGVLLYSKSEAEIYVVDNASTDDSMLFLETEFPEVKVIKNAENYGYAKGYNEGLKHIEADLFVLLNSDVAVTENWLSPIIQQFKNNPKIAAAQPKILDYKNKDYFEYAGAAGGFIDKYGYPYCRGRIFNTLEKDKGQYDETSEIFWASGACLFVRKDAFEQVSGFDEDYFAHQEEIDLCWRLFNLDYKVICVNQSKVYHLGGGTLKNTNPKKTYLNFRNSLFNLLKNAPKSKITGRIFIRMLLDGIAGIQFILSFKLSHFIAILRAHLSFYNNLRKTLQKRTIQSKKENYYHHKSIVFSYFVKQIKSFNKL
ncbi:MAG: glycosyltransferase family 2 protein [Flavobacteriaceae bacterium]